MEEKLVLSVEETARALGISIPSVYNLIHRADFPSFKCGKRTLISKPGLEAWIAEQLVKGVTG